MEVFLKVRRKTSIPISPLIISKGLVMFCGCERFFEVDTREQHKDKCLQECYKKLEEPKWKHENTSDWTCWDECPKVCHDTDEGHTGKYIGKKSNRKRNHTRKFTKKVNPSDRNVDNLLDERRS